MKLLETLGLRVRQFGLRRSAAVYLVIVVGLALASEFAGDQISGQGAANPGAAILSALAIAALVGIFVFFLFHGAVEDRERAGVALANSEERFRSLTSLSADWFWETDPGHRISWIAGGQSMLKLFGSELAYGRRIWEIPGIAVPEAAIAAHLEALEAQAPFHELELCRPGPDGQAEYHLISGEPRVDRAGRFLGYRGVGRDVTGSKRAAAALSGAKERLELALNSGALAIWDSNLSTGRIFVSEGWAQILGEPAGDQWLRVEEVLERVHPQDREAGLLASRRALKGETASYMAEIRLRLPTGDWKWVVASGQVVERDAGGRALRMTGTVVDVDRRKRAEHALRDAEVRYRTLVDLSPDGVLLQSDGRIEYANRAAAEILGTPRPASLIGLVSMELIHPDDCPRILERVRYLRGGPGKADFSERRMLRLDGSVVTVEGASVSYLERGRLVVQTVLRDISERVNAREELAERERRFRDVVEAAGEYVWETDCEFRYTWISARVEAVLGHVHADLIGRRPQDFMPLGEARAVEEQLLRASHQGVPFRDLVHRSITKSGRAIWQSISGVPVFDQRGKLKGFRGTGADITARRQAEERIQFLATRDAVTGLPNRVLLADRAGQAILNAGRKQGRIAVLAISLDRFHLVNDSLGHRAGDALVRATAERFSNALRRDDTLARVGGEEFVVLWDGTREVEDVALVAKKLLACLAAPVVIDARPLNVSASIGISVYPGDGKEFSELLNNADAARYAAREADGNTYRFFSRELNSRALERLDMESALHRALAGDEFVLHFQPVVRSAGAAMPRVVGAEVLLRWQHPQRGLLAPGEFIPFAEQAGLMGALGDWLVERATAQVAQWEPGPSGGLWFALNVPAKEVFRDRRFSESLREALQRNRLDGSRFVLEISERSMQAGGDARIDALGAVAALGVALTIDDFGAGHSSLASLREMPVRKLKVDRSLVADLVAREDAAVIVQTVTAMARGLGLSVAAEGVETEAQLARLRAAGCDEWQGRLFSEPLDAAAFEALISGASRAASA
ncbi:MAG: EAL domain-containing protein [Proteobacteria bacterium]|nr:EAL domain-containing protein [Pseudomonadota bacterium]